MERVKIIINFHYTNKKKVWKKKHGKIYIHTYTCRRIIFHFLRSFPSVVSCCGLLAITLHYMNIYVHIYLLYYIIPLALAIHSPPPSASQPSLYISQQQKQKQQRKSRFIFIVIVIIWNGMDEYKKKEWKRIGRSEKGKIENLKMLKMTILHAPLTCLNFMLT